MALDGYAIVAAVLALIGPLALIITRQELQNVRSQIIDDLRRILFKEQGGLPQIELVAARYRSQATSIRRRKIGLGDEAGSAPGRSRSDQVVIWPGAFTFALVCYAGFWLLFTPISWLISEGAVFPSLTAAFFWISPNDGLNELKMSVAIAGMGFLGAYIFWLRYLTRATLNDELSALAFARAATGVLGAVIVAVVTVRIVSELASVKLVNAQLGLAMAIGYKPDLGLRQVTRWAGAKFKSVDDQAIEKALIIPLEIIDGIDPETSMRLQESNLYDVQNLATTNPIELYAETPYGLFETFDWVLQAQLCVIVGAKTFHNLKAHNIRTIFDLERAVLAAGAPADYVQALGAVLYDTATPAFLTKVGLPVPGVSPPGANTISVDVVRHAVAIIGDDLHVHRLRALWTAMLRTTSGGSNHWLYQTGPLPGEGGGTGVGLTPAAAAAVQLAAALGAGFKASSEQGKSAAELEPLRTEALAAVKQALGFSEAAREHLRRLFNPDYLNKDPSHAALEVFFNDEDFRSLLG